MRTSQKSWGGGLSRRAKLVVALVVVLLLALPIFAIANSDAIQSVFADFQQSFSNNQIVADYEPMSLEEGIEALSISGRTVVEVSLGQAHGLAILSDGTLWAWGSGALGQTGLGSSATVIVPTQVGSLNTWQSVYAGHSHSLALQSNGTLWAWGQGAHGRLGLGHEDNVNIPTQVGNLSTWDSIAAGITRSFAIQQNGSLWAWGDGAAGATGLDHTNNVNVPTQVGTATTWQSVTSANNNSAAIQQNGTLWTWGGHATNLGFSAPSSVHVPTQVGSGTNWQSVSLGNTHALALQQNGTLWGWGSGAGGQLGTGNTSDVIAPVQIGNSTAWRTVSAGFDQSVATQTNGSLWGWGTGGDGQHGLGHRSNVNVPTRVAGFPVWSTATTGMWFSAAIQDDGTLWTYGWGGAGRLGQNISTDVLVPTLVHAQVFGTAPANSATNVALTTDTLTIIFDRPMDANFNVPTGTNGSVTINQGASVDMSAATWTHTVTHSSLSVPLTLTTAGALHTVNVVGFGSITGGFPALDHSFTFTTPRTPGDVDSDFTKTLTMPEGTTPRNVDFDFSFTPRQVDITEGSTTITSRPTGQVPTISNQTINLLAADATTTGGTTTIIGSLNLANLLDTLTFSGGGLFVWEVAEVAGSSNTNTNPAGPNFMTYDNTRFFLVAYIYSCGTFGALNIHAATPPVAPATAFTVGAKLDAINFNNQYRVDREDTALDIRKAVTGRFANLDTLFSFTLSLQGHTLAPLPTPTGTTPPFSVSILDASNNTVTRTIGFSYNSTTLEQILTFQLRDGERLVIPTLPAGTTFRVVETGTAGFTPQVQVFSGGTEVNLSALEGANLDTGSHLLREEGDNSARYTNAYRDITPTGLSISNAPYIAIAALVILAVLIATTRKRKSIEELPVV